MELSKRILFTYETIHQHNRRHQSLRDGSVQPVVILCVYLQTEIELYADTGRNKIHSA
jgi:hypothetical protein